MIKYDIDRAEYAVCNLEGFTLTEALRFWKAKFETIQHFKRDVIVHPALRELGNFVEEMWENIRPITVKEAFTEQNMEKRRVMFDCIGVSRLFQALEPELLDRQTIQKKQTRWDKNNEPYEHGFEDNYELYRIEGEKLFNAAGRSGKPPSVYAVRCWCTTTGREYWIYVPERAAIGNMSGYPTPEPKPDAIRAIAWTIRLDVSQPKAIYRQGDIIIAEESGYSVDVPPYHLSKEQYLSLMVSET